MKIAISYPPIKSDKGVPLLSQNRQFQWFNSPTYIYPVIPAYTASLLKETGYDVIWDDAIAKEISYEDWFKNISEQKPDLIVIETKTPVIKRHWEIINKIKEFAEKNNWKLKVAIVGDHVTAFPEESLKYSKVDFVLSGGDYDFGVKNLALFLEKKEKLEPGWWLRTDGEWTNQVDDNDINWKGGYHKNLKTNNSGEKQDYHLHNLDTLPVIDRKLTNWKLYAFKNGNFKFTPGSYMMSGRDCWWGRCTFCSWTTLFPGKNFRTMSAKKAILEVENLVSLGVKEIMEDSGSLPIGAWIDEFCNLMIEKGLNKKVTISCNMRINGIKNPDTWLLMKKAGFRFILFGFESANQKTLEKIDKGLKVEEVFKGLSICKQAGLEPHITAMIGYPWESYEEAKKTVDTAKDLFKKGVVDTLQATVLIPYPGTPLYKYCKENDLLNFTDYDRFDQREQVMKCSLSTEQVKELTQGLYKAFITPKFILRKMFSIRNFDDVKFLFKAGIKVLGHLTDFKK